MKNTFAILLSLILISSCKTERKINPDITVILELNQQELLKQLAKNKVRRNIFIDTYNNSSEIYKTDSTQDFFSLFGETFFKLHPSHNLRAIFDIEKNDKYEVEIKELVELKKQIIDNQINKINIKLGNYYPKNIQVVKYTKTNSGLIIDIKGNISEEKLIETLNTKKILAFYHTYRNTEVGNQIFENVNKILSDGLYPGYIDSVENKLINKKKYFDSSTEITEDINWDEYYEESEEEIDIKIFQKTAPLSSCLFPYANSENQWIEGPVLGYSKLSDTAKVNDYLSKPYVKTILPVRDLAFMWETKSMTNTNDGEPLVMLYLIKKTLNNEPLLSGKEVQSAKQEFDSYSNSPMVSLQFNSTGATIWADITEQSARNQTGIAICLNGKVFSAPTASDRIEGGGTQITGGSFAGENGIFEAKDLANILNNGTTPIESKIKNIIKHKKEQE